MPNLLAEKHFELESQQENAGVECHQYLHGEGEDDLAAPVSRSLDTAGLGALGGGPCSHGVLATHAVAAEQPS